MRERVVRESLRVAVLAVVTCAAAMVTWWLSGTGSAEDSAIVTRAATVARGGSHAGAASQGARHEIDARWSPVAGIPVTVIDAGRAVRLTAGPGTIARFLGELGISLGPLDRIDRDPGTVIRAGDVVRITRVGDREETLREPVAHQIQYVSDPDLEAGRQVVLARGLDGLALDTYVVRVVEGREIGRTLVARTEVYPPVTEVVAVGARPRPAPRAPAEIDSVIRDAAARYGADAEQLLRVAWCESRYDPSAYNPTHADSGLFQFIPTTWAANSVRAGYVGASPFDPVAAANVAAWMFSRGSASLWTCR